MVPPATKPHVTQHYRPFEGGGPSATYHASRPLMQKVSRMCCQTGTCDIPTAVMNTHIHTHTAGNSHHVRSHRTDRHTGMQH